MSNSPETIAIIHHDFGIGGAERLMLDMGLSLQEMGHKVDFYTGFCDKSRSFTELHSQEKGVLLTVVGSWIPLLLFGKFRALMSIVKMIWISVYVIFFSKKKYSIMITDGPGYTCIPLFLLVNTRVVFYCHYPDKLLNSNKGVLSTLYRHWIDACEDKFIAMSHLVLCNSRYTMSVMLNHFPTVRKMYSQNSSWLRVLAPMVEVEGSIVRVQQFQNRDCQPWNELPFAGAITSFFLSLNRFERKKELELAIWAFHRMRSILNNKERTDILENCGLVIAGGFDTRLTECQNYLLELRELVSTLELDDYVTFVLSPNDTLKKSLITSAVALLYTPQNEHFGIVPLEAMAVSCPVIACNSGGPLETVIHRKTGYLVKPRAKSFARRMEYLLSNPNTNKQMGAFGYLHVKRHFSRQIFSQNLLFVVNATDTSRIQQ